MRFRTKSVKEKLSRLWRTTSSQSPVGTTQSDKGNQVEEARRLLGIAIDADEKHHEDAVELYIASAQYCLETANATTGKTSKQLQQFSKQAIERAERLKNQQHLLVPEVSLEQTSTKPYLTVGKWSMLTLLGSSFIGFSVFGTVIFGFSVFGTSFFGGITIFGSSFFADTIFGTAYFGRSWLGKQYFINFNPIAYSMHDVIFISCILLFLFWVLKLLKFY